MVVAKVSAIHDISRSPVLMSGAGTSIPGPADKQTDCVVDLHKGPSGCVSVFLTNEAFLGQFNGEPTGDLLQLIVLDAHAHAHKY